MSAVPLATARLPAALIVVLAMSPLLATSTGDAKTVINPPAAHIANPAIVRMRRAG
jgi:hypothetical protein